MVARQKMLKKRASSSTMNTQSLLDLDLEESSSDSDFRIEDHDDESDDFSDDNSNEDEDDDADGSENDGDSEENSDDNVNFSNFKNRLNASKTTVATNSNKKTISVDQQKQQQQAAAKAKEALEKANAKILATPICCACLGDRSDDTNEIVECDNCGISVHEGCYGISDSNSVSSTVSSCSTEPWFCEACKANATDPICELCPNKGGIFKETDVGKWVHLVCALYVPGVAFGEVDQLSSVTLFEMPYSKWGAKTCSLCEDVRFSRTGVCIGCDAGMCKTYFHVTCAQAAGLLSEAHSEEADHADPFYAHCKIHSDKALIKHRKRNYHGLRVKMEHRQMERQQKKIEKPTDGQKRIERKLKKHRNKYITLRAVKSEPWVPTQKMPRLLTTSASACRKLILKAELMGINAAASEFQETQMAALADVRKKWHIPPAFSVEFIGYYLDRIARIKEIKTNLHEQLEHNKILVNQQQSLRDEYDHKVKLHNDHSNKNAQLKDSIQKLHEIIQTLCPTKHLSSVESIGRPLQQQTPQLQLPLPPPPPIARPMAVPTAAALKMGVGFPLTNLPGITDDTNRILSTQCQNNSKLMHECGICKHCTDQHLLAKCDTCQLHYHLGCLNPPLTRHPKKSKLYGWQCSECVKSDDSDCAVTLPAGPRKSRTKYSKDGTIVPVDPIAFESYDDRRSSINSNKSSTKTSPISTAAAATTNKKQQHHEKIEEVLVPQMPIVIIDSDSAASNNGGGGGRIGVKSKRKLKSNAKITISPKIGQPVVVLSNNIDSRIQPPSRNEIASPSSPPPLDPLDISNAQQIIIPHTVSTDDESQRISKKKKKLKSSNDTTTTTTTATTNSTPIKSPSYYVDRNGILNSIDALVPHTKAGHFTSELIPGTAPPPPPPNDNNSTTEQLTNKQIRKRRKEKHREKYDSDGRRSSSKEHKKKRKRDKHDMEAPSFSSTAEGIPRIKIKFKALPLPGETTPEPQFFYVSADMVRGNISRRSPLPAISSLSTLPSASPSAITKPGGGETRSQSVVTSPTTIKTKLPKSPNIKSLPATPSTSAAFKIGNTTITQKTINEAFKSSPIRTRRLSICHSPQLIMKKIAKRNIAANVSALAQSGGGSNISSTMCDVCRTQGTANDLVKCDECKKNYHFKCLEPPVKKTPKRRGYSWHCADCDPTDIESN